MSVKARVYRNQDELADCNVDSYCGLRMRTPTNGIGEHRSNRPVKECPLRSWGGGQGPKPAASVMKNDMSEHALARQLTDGYVYVSMIRHDHYNWYVVGANCSRFYSNVYKL